MTGLGFDWVRQYVVDKAHEGCEPQEGKISDNLLQGWKITQDKLPTFRRSFYFLTIFFTITHNIYVIDNFNTFFIVDQGCSTLST